MRLSYVLKFSRYEGYTFDLLLVWNKDELIYTAPIFHDHVIVLCSEEFSRYEGYTFDLLSVWNKDELINSAPIFHYCAFVLCSE